MIRDAQDLIEQQNPAPPPIELTEEDLARDQQINAGVQEAQYQRMQEERCAWEVIMGELPGIQELTPDEGCLSSSPHGFVRQPARQV